MAITYQKFDHDGVTLSVNKKVDGKWVLAIPLEPKNRDYAEYLEWVAAGNTPEASD